MQYVPIHLAQELWDATPERNWSALRDRVHERIERGGEFEAVSPTTLLQSINHLAHIGAEYPDSPEELSRVLNQQVRELAD
ncbi:MAG TPA: hypothetical protein VF043_39645 [Ktedonobacteraceae bacterium]